MSEQKFPLDWPQGYKKTEYPKRSAFVRPSLAQSVSRIVNEVKALCGRSVTPIISSDVPLKNDGFPRAAVIKKYDV